MGRTENRLKRRKTFDSKLVTREDAAQLIKEYHVRYVSRWIDWCNWKQLPLWKRAWLTVKEWWKALKGRLRR
jgi:hypothetical protein